MTAQIYAGLPEATQRKASYKILGRNAQYIINKTAEALELDPAAIISTSRKRKHMDARIVIIGLVLSFNPLVTLKVLGAMLGGRDHSTIINARQRFEWMSKKDKVFMVKVKKVMEII